MAGQASDATARSSELALAAYLEEVVAGRRVLWLGDSAGDAADHLARSAESVMVLAPNPPPKDESRRRAARISALRPGPLSFRPGSFDVVVAPALETLGLDSAERVGELRDVLDGRGVLVAGTDAREGLGYEELFELLSESFDAVRMVGQAPFHAWTLVDLEAVAGDYDVTFDGSLMDEEPRARRWLAVAGFEDAELDAYCVVQVAGAPAAEEPARLRRRRRRDEREDRRDEREDRRDEREDHELAGSSDAEAPGAEELARLEERLRERQREVDAANEHAESIETSLAQRTGELEALRDELDAARDELAELREQLAADREAREAPSEPPAPSAKPDAGEDDGVVSGDYQRLEHGLAEQGRRVLELEREVERRGTLVRDLVEELRDYRTAGGSGSAGGAGSAGGSSAGSAGGSSTAGGGGGAVGGARTAELDAALERAMAAEAARAEAQFQIDELMGRLASSEGGEQQHEQREQARREAQLSGTVRGLRSRVAEVEEMRELAEGRLSVLRLDLEDQRARSLELEKELGELREQFELELVRARGEPGQPVTEGDFAERIAELRASENRLSERVGALSGQLLACRDLLQTATEERDHARADNLRLTALVSSLQDRFDGARRGYETRIAEMIHDGLATDESRRLEREVEELRGERDGLRHRLADREAALAAGGGQQDARIAEAREERERLKAELDRLRMSHSGESARVTDAEERARRESQRAEELTASAGAREALVTRLQMDLAQEEGRRQSLGQQLARAEEENERLRGALLDASERVDEALDAESRVDAADVARTRAEAALAETRRLLASLAEGLGVPVSAVRREITAVGMESPEGSTGAAPDAQVLRHRATELEKQLADQDTLMRSLTAQIEERDDRVRALERRLEGSVGVEGDEEALRREVMELQERAARLSDELLHERRARRAAESAASGRKRTSSGEVDLRSLHERLGQSDAELLLLKGQQATSERDLKTIRDACAQARNGLEELLGSATADGDPATAEKIGTILRLLNRF